MDLLGFSIYVLSAVQRPPNLLKAVETFLQDLCFRKTGHGRRNRMAWTDWDHVGPTASSTVRCQDFARQLRDWPLDKFLGDEPWYPFDSLTCQCSWRERHSSGHRFGYEVSGKLSLDIEGQE